MQEIFNQEGHQDRFEIIASKAIHKARIYADLQNLNSDQKKLVITSLGNIVEILAKDMPNQSDESLISLAGDVFLTLFLLKQQENGQTVAPNLKSN